MKRLLRKIEAALQAVAFAEEGDADTARHLLAEVEQGGERSAPPERASPSRPLTPRAVPRRARGA